MNAFIEVFAESVLVILIIACNKAVKIWELILSFVILVPGFGIH